MKWPIKKPYTLTNGPPHYRPTPPWYVWAHPGVDIACAAGRTIRSPMTGVVIAVGTDPNYIGGRYVIVREDRKPRLEHYMGHARKTVVKVGQKVKEGQKVGEVGQTGQATGPHVHYQIRKYGGGRTMNPFKVFRERT